MTDLTKLKELAERALGSSFNADAMSSPLGQFCAAANPQAILGLIAEVERLRTRLEIDERTPYDGIACRDETIKGLDEKCDRLKAENEALRKLLDSGRYYIPENKIELLGLIDAALEGGGR